MKKPLIDQGIFTPAELGTIGSALFYTYAIGKLTNGFLADHANARRFLAAAFLLTRICNVLMGFTTQSGPRFVWGLNGWFQSFGAPGGVVAMTAWFSNSERGRAYGIWSTAHSIGEGLTFLVVGGLVAWLGWQWGLLGPGTDRHRDRDRRVRAAAGSAANAGTSTGQRVEKRPLSRKGGRQPREPPLRSNSRS